MIQDLVISLVVAILLFVFGWMFREREYWIIALKCATVYRNRKLRVSMAALLKFEKDGQYLLIRNKKRPELFGPIGGVFKYFDSAIHRLDKIGFIPQYPSKAGVFDHDLRGYIEAKKFSSFMSWFKSRENREIEPLTRELIEELEEINLDEIANQIKAPRLELVRTIYEGINAVPGVEYLQYRYFRIYQIGSNDSQGINSVDQLFDIVDTTKHLISVNADEIAKGRSNNGEFIGPHSMYLIGNRRFGNEPAPHN